MYDIEVSPSIGAYVYGFFMEGGGQPRLLDSKTCSVPFVLNNNCQETQMNLSAFCRGLNLILDLST